MEHLDNKTYMNVLLAFNCVSLSRVMMVELHQLLEILSLVPVFNNCEKMHTIISSTEYFGIVTHPG